MPYSTTSFDEEGFLLDLTKWDKDTARLIASHEMITLTKEHWEIINLVRSFYNEYDLSPSIRPLAKYIKKHLSEEKSRSIYLMTLFPGSPAKLACKIAGLPKPDNCL